MTATDASAEQYDDLPRGSKRSALRWTTLAVIGRQLFQLGCALVIARILGPASFGVISVATIFINFTSLVLDQGFASALIQRPVLSRRAPGAVATLNITAAVVLGVAALLLAGPIATFFDEGEVELLIQLLGAGLVLKGLAIVPRAMLSRQLNFKPVAVADVIGYGAGAAAGIAAALSSAGVLSIVFQVFVTDLIVASVLLICARGPLPNFHLRALRELLGFSVRVFATNFIAYLARNADNVLVGRFLGVTSLAYYGMAYRVLVIPVQLIGQTVNRVMFPLFSRQADDRAAVAADLLRATGLLSLTAIPLMSLIAVAAPDIIEIVLGDEWSPVAPILSVLAIAGARETIFYITPSLMKAMGHAALNLRYEIAATTVQILGIVAGLAFGVVGVAVGYLVAGFLLTPFLLRIQSSICDTRIAVQLRAIAPYVHASLWGAAVYLAITLLPLIAIGHLLIGGGAFIAIAGGVLLLFHRRRFLRDFTAVLLLLRREPPRTKV